MTKFEKNKGLGVVGIIIAFAVVIFAGGGGIYFYKTIYNLQPTTNNKTTEGIKQTMQTQVKTASSTESVDTTNWKTYKNTKKGYEISYPVDAEIYTADLSCVRIYTKEFGSVYIDSAGESEYPCGMPTGLGIEMIRSQDNITIADKQYPTSGWRKSDNSFSFLSSQSFIFGKISIVIGVGHYDRNDSKFWKDLGSLTDSEYQNALNSVKMIAATLKAN
jgi:hypothetical protein